MFLKLIWLYSVVVVFQTIFQHLPQQRRLQPETKLSTKKLIQLGANKKRVQQQLMAETGMVVTLKDVHNLGSEDSSGAPCGMSVNHVAHYHLQSQPAQFTGPTTRSNTICT